MRRPRKSYEKVVMRVVVMAESRFQCWYGVQKYWVRSTVNRLVHILRLAGEKVIAAVGSAVEFVFRDNDHVVTDCAATRRIVGRGAVVVGADVDLPRITAGIENCACDRPARSHLPVLTLAAVVTEVRLVE